MTDPDDRPPPPLARQLEIRHLRMVEAIARTRSVSRAAEALFISQPALSHALRTLESRLGMPLFARSSHGMVATRAGEQLLATAREVLAAIERLDLGLGRGAPPPLRVTTQCYTRHPWLPAALAEFEAGGDVAVELVADAAERPIDALRDNAVDVAVTHEEPTGPDLRGLRLGRDELLAVVPAGHPLAALAALEPSVLAAQTLYLHSAPAQSAVVRRFLAPAGAPARDLRALHQTDAVLDVVRGGLGVTVLSQWLLRDADAADLVRLRLGAAGLFCDWWVVGRAGRWHEPRLQRLVAVIARELRARLGQPDPDLPGSTPPVG